MKIPARRDYILFGGTFVLANKLQFVGDKMVEGLSTKQWFLARTIMDMPKDPPPTIMEIARETDSTRQNVTKMLEKMERDGYLLFEDNEADRRSRRVRMTELGLWHAQQVAANGEDFLLRLFAGIAQDELDTASGVILKMLDNLTLMQAELRERDGDGRWLQS